MQVRSLWKPMSCRQALKGPLDDLEEELSPRRLPPGWGR